MNTTTETKKRKKLNATILSLRKDSEDRKPTGIFMGVKMLVKEDGTPVTGSKGQELGVIILKDKETEENFEYWADAGLRGSLKMAKVKEGMDIEIEHVGEKEIDKGIVQTYDIFENQ